MLCFIGRHFLLDDLFHLRVCIIGGYVLQFVMSYWSTCSKFNKFILPLNLLIGFFLVNLSSHVKMH